jgi:hypothetical protein
MKLQMYTLANYAKMSHYNLLTPEQIEAIEVVGNVLPFKTNNYVVDELIDWANL